MDKPRGTHFDQITGRRVYLVQWTAHALPVRRGAAQGESMVTVKLSSGDDFIGSPEAFHKRFKLSL